MRSFVTVQASTPCCQGAPQALEGFGELRDRPRVAIYDRVVVLALDAHHLAVDEVGLEVHEAGGLLAAHLDIRVLVWMAGSAGSSVSLNRYTDTRTAA
jgi:hypothetical protein